MASSACRTANERLSIRKGADIDSEDLKSPELQEKLKACKTGEELAAQSRDATRDALVIRAYERVAEVPRALFEGLVIQLKTHGAKVLDQKDSSRFFQRA